MKKIIGFLCMIMLLMYNVMYVHAATFINCGDADGKIAVQSYQSKYGEAWCNVINKSINAWNNSSANVAISVSDSSNNKILVRKYDEAWYGLATQTCSSAGYTSKFDIKINSRTIRNDASSYAKFARSTLTHEFGHIFWLADDPDTSQKSIMKYSRDRNVMVKPQTFDINNVNQKYR